MQHFYTHAIDMTDSEAFYQGFYDDVEKVLYLTFRTGTMTSRIVPSTTTPEDVEEIDSWGRQWWASIKDMPTGPTVDPGDEFVYREAPVQAALAAEATLLPREDEPTDEAWDAFVSSLENVDEDWIIDGSEAALQAAVAAALEAERQTVTTETANDEPAEGLAEATRNSEGTFVGIGFIDVPDDLKQRLLSVVSIFDEFVQGEFGEVNSFVESYDIDTMRNFMRGLL